MPGQLDCGIVSGLAARKNTAGVRLHFREWFILKNFCMIVQMYKLRNCDFAEFMSTAGDITHGLLQFPTYFEKRDRVRLLAVQLRVRYVIKHI